MKVAIVGGGQLARMLAQAGIPLGVQFSFLLSPSESSRCVDGLGDCVVFDPAVAFVDLYQALGQPDVVTIESENVNIDILEGLNPFCNICPNVETAKSLKNRFNEKSLLSNNNINTAKFFSFRSFAELEEKASTLNFPIVIKSCTGGYDGKFQFRLKTPEDLKGFENEMSPAEQFPDGFIAEEFIHFSREISFIGARSSTGEVKFYPPAENEHQNAVLLKSVAPAKDVSPEIEQTGQRFLQTLMDTVDYVGVLAMECFEKNDGESSELIVNELAPRVHNSGHWSQAGEQASQFENHVRAILGLELGSTETNKIAGMLNILGQDCSQLSELDHDAELVWYDKEVRPGRKLGHINVLAESYDTIEKRLEELYKAVYE